MKPSCFHIYIISKLKTKFPAFRGTIIERAQVRHTLIRSHIPEQIHRDFLKELAGFGFIKFNNRRKIELNHNSEHNVELDQSKDDYSIEILK